MKTEQMLARARSRSAGLIVLGVHAKSFLERHLHSSFAYQLLANATCPIISIHHKARPA
jgi:nucleotide-binding universal stress UspA family protein